MLQYRDIPDAARQRPVTSRLIADTPITSGDPMRFMAALDYRYHVPPPLLPKNYQLTPPSHQPHILPAPHRPPLHPQLHLHPALPAFNPLCPLKQQWKYLQRQRHHLPLQIPTTGPLRELHRPSRDTSTRRIESRDDAERRQ